MKKITTLFKFALLLVLAFNLRTAYSQCAASFNYAVGSGGVVNFTNTSTPSSTAGTSYWIFGNGSAPTITPSPFVSATYTANGTYTIYMIYSTGTCSNAVTQTISITTAVTPTCNLVASAAYSLGASNGQVLFANTSTGVSGGATYSWNFGDGSPNSTNASPTHNYASNGAYTVTLTVNNNYVPACISTYTMVVNVTNGCTMVPAFTYTVGAGGVVNFQNTTTGTGTATTFQWALGNGTYSFNVNNPAATYTANGAYIVVLSLVSPACGTVQVSHTITVTTSTTTGCTLVPGFTYTVGAGGVVNFLNTSTGGPVTSYQWYLGNGTYSFNVNSPTATYTANGSYVVTLGLIAPGCGTVQLSHTITVNTNTTTSPCTLNAGFTTSQGSNGLVNFNNTSTGTGSTTTYSWNFGDGGTSTSSSPAHTYTANGTYPVLLVASNNSTPACTSSYTAYVTVSSICNLTASFGYTLNANGNVIFQNTSTGTGLSTHYSWNLGDGTTASGATASHNYVNGTYVVSFVVTNTAIPGCSSTATQVITVTSNTCVANANFSVIPTGTAQYWYAIPSVTAGVTAAVWYWGDGSSSTGLFSSHVYAAPGNYTLCLSVTVSCGGTASSCSNYYISRSANDNSMVYVNVVTAEQVATGIKHNASEDIAYVVSPNPSNGAFTVRMNGVTASKAGIQVYNLIGKLVYQSDSDVSNGSITKEINLDTVSEGVYFVKVTADGKTYSKKLIVNK